MLSPLLFHSKVVDLDLYNSFSVSHDIYVFTLLIGLWLICLRLVRLDMVISFIKGMMHTILNASIVFMAIFRKMRKENVFLVGMTSMASILINGAIGSVKISSSNLYSNTFKTQFHSPKT